MARKKMKRAVVKHCSNGPECCTWHACFKCGDGLEVDSEGKFVCMTDGCKYKGRSFVLKKAA